MLDTRTFPEAPVSLTAHIRVPHISKDALLVTGRGATAADAVANLHAAIAAVQRPLAPLPLPPQAERIAALLVSLLNAVITTKEVHRAAQASTYLLQDRVHWHHSVPDACAVREFDTHDDELFQVVTELSCTCPEWQEAHLHNPYARFICVHMLAAQWWKQINATKDTV